MSAAPPRTVGYVAALAIVIANVVGTGVFTTVGLQAQGVSIPLALLPLWAIGGIVALGGVHRHRYHRACGHRARDGAGNLRREIGVREQWHYLENAATWFCCILRRPARAIGCGFVSSRCGFGLRLTARGSTRPGR